MSECWKCGRVLEAGNECEYGCTPTGDGELDEPDPDDYAMIDWDKVTTFEHLKLIVKELGHCDCVYKKGETFQLLKRFVREDDL